MAEEHAGLLADAHTWILFSAILFAIVAWKKGKAPLLAMLDGRTARIRAELEEAARLRNEAQMLLADYQQKNREAEATAQKIIDNAKASAASIQASAEKKLTEDMTRREQQLLGRIARAEAAAVQEVRRQAADIAAAAARTLITEGMGKQGTKLVDEAIHELPQRLN